MSQWAIELELEVREWLDALPLQSFATVAFHLDRLAELGPQLRMPHSRSLGDGLFELRFDLDPVAQRISFYFPGGQRIVLLTVFRKQRDNERLEIARARSAMRTCIAEAHRLEDEES